MNKIIIILFSIFGEKEFLKYNINDYLKKKISVEVWTLTNKNKKKKSCFRVKYFSRLSLLLKQIHKINKNNVVFDVLFFLTNIKTFRVYKALSLSNSIYITHPINYVPSVKKSKSFFNINKYLNLENYYFKIEKNLFNFSLFLRKIFYIQNLKCANYSYFRTKKEIYSNKNNLLISKKTKILWGHVSDYNIYQKDTKNNKLEEKYIVFLDQKIPSHSDLAKFRDIDSDKYYKSIIAFLNKLELMYKKKIHICLHPRDDLRSMRRYLPFDCSIGKTYEMIKKSAIVVTHGSDATHLAVLLMKPIIIITNDQLNNSSYPHLKEIQDMGFKLKKNILNVDVSFKNSVISRSIKVSKKNYKIFTKNYIKYKGSSVTRSELIYKTMINEKIWR
jgi:hypothetical protein